MRENPDSQLIALSVQRVTGHHTTQRQANFECHISILHDSDCSSKSVSFNPHFMTQNSYMTHSAAR